MPLVKPKPAIETTEPMTETLPQTWSGPVMLSEPVGQHLTDAMDRCLEPALVVRRTKRYDTSASGAPPSGDQHGIRLAIKPAADPAMPPSLVFASRTLVARWPLKLTSKTCYDPKIDRY